MTDNEIIKALECCCEANLKVDCQKLKCPFFDNEIYNCMNVDDENAMYRYSLDLINRQQAEIERLKTFKSYFDELYGKGLEVANWHENGDLEPFDDFYDSAIREMVGEG